MPGKGHIKLLFSPDVSRVQQELQLHCVQQGAWEDSLEMLDYLVQL